MERRVRRPTEEEVIGKLKDDGDFDSLRLKIIRKVKENEELRNSIITEAKQSMVLNEDGSEKLKVRELSDAIYKELGSRIMGRISDEVWKVMNEADIRGAVKTVYNCLANPEVKREIKKEVQTSPKKRCIENEQGRVSPAKRVTFEASTLKENEPEEPPGFALSSQQASSNVEVKQLESLNDQKLHSSLRENDHLQSVDALPPGFCLHGTADALPGSARDEDPDLPPGFG